MEFYNTANNSFNNDSFSKGKNNMEFKNTPYELITSENCTPAFALPHCAVMLVLDTSHSMWGQGLADLQLSLKAFFGTIARENFPNAQLHIAAVSMGDNFGMLEEFTPFAQSTLPGMKIRPKGNTPLGAALTLALDKIEAQTALWKNAGVSRVTPQLVILSDGKSSDDFSAAVYRLRQMTGQNRLFSRAIALGNSPDMGVLTQIASEKVISAGYGSMRHAFTEVGDAVSQTYEAEAPQVIMAEHAQAAPRSGVEYILDGSNILHWAGQKNVSLKNILAITTELDRQKIPFKVVFDASAPHILNKNGERTVYEELLHNRPEEFLQVPAGTVADKFILLHAEEDSRRMIITNDRYLDHEAEHPWIRKSPRRISGMVIGGKIYIPKINMSVPVGGAEI